MPDLTPPPSRHLQPHAEVAERVLAPGDPGRALRLAQWLLEKPRMLNHHRGLWGYTGKAEDGELLTIQSTGMGGPSAAIVVHELARLGARRIVRLGTGRALGDGARLGDVLVVRETIGEDGTSRALGAPGRLPADEELTRKLAAAAGSRARTATVVSTDVFYESGTEQAGRRKAMGAQAVDLETAGLLAAAGRSGVAAGCLLAITDPAGNGDAPRIAGELLASVEEAMGRAGAAALS